MLRALIIDDEIKSRNLIRTFTNNYCPELKIEGEADSVKTAIALIRREQPDLIFLDIELKDGLGLEVLDHFRERSFISILITGYDTYAIEAIKREALDYILKPLVIKDLVAAVGKAKKKLQELKFIDQFKRERDVTISNDEKIIVTDTRNNLKAFSLMEVLYVEAQNQYTEWHLQDGTHFIQRSTLSRYEGKLPDYFFQTHRSYIVNLHAITLVEKEQGWQVVIGENKLPIAHRRRKNFLKKLKKFSL